MSTTLLEIRRAKMSDAPDVAETHDEAWRSAYRGIIPGAELEKLVNRRGPDWWDSAIRKGSRITLLQFGDRVAGYANYGRNRARSLFYDGEIYELYLRPEFQGLGFGRRLFSAARKDLVQSGLKSLVVWALSDNEPAMEFYRAIAADDHVTTARLIDEFFLPYLAIRNRRAGYAVSIVKAGTKLVGHDAGPVRAPLTDLDEDELAQLDVLIKKLGAQ